MQSLPHFLLLALQSLLRNRMQSGLAMLGVTVGVGALVTSLALGRGAQDQIAEQLRAAGANVIVVTSGNYQAKRELRMTVEPGHEAAGINGQRFLPASQPATIRTAWRSGHTHGVLRKLVWRPTDSPGRLRKVHFEDDPMAKHDHPVAAERLGDAMAGLGAAATLTRDDAEAIRREIPGVQFVSSGVHENARVYVQGRDSLKWFTRLHGAESELPEIRSGWTFPHGRFLSEKEVDKAEQVMVLGRVVSDKLFGADVDPVGKQVVLWNQPFRVVGVVGSRNWATQPAPGDDQFDAIYIPVSTVHRLLNLSKLNTITITAASAGETTMLAKQIEELLRKRHRIGPEMPDDFTVRTMAQQKLTVGLPPELAMVVTGNQARVEQLTIEQLSASLKRSNRTMLGLLASVATVSLLVGGIGVMNLLLLSVTQRTREIGLRMAIGARSQDIALQFLFEGVLLSIVGGVLGVFCGVLASGGLEQFFQWSAVISPLSAVLAVVVAALLGVSFGVFPARRAAQLDPIEALHHE